MIHFRKLVIENFLSYRGRTVVHLAGQGVVRIEGRNLDDAGATSNMAGKSTIIEALLWCLFGKTLRGVKHNDVVNRRAKRNCHVSVSFVSENIRYTCRRYRKHEKFQNHLQLIREGSPLSYRHEDDSESKLWGILGCDFRSFVNSTVFGGFDGARRQFALLTDKDQKEVLDSFLQFEKFELALDRTKTLLKEARESLVETTLAITEQNGKVNLYGEKTATLLAGANLLQSRERKERRRLFGELRKLKPVDVTTHDEEIEGAEEKVQAFSNKLAHQLGSRDAARRSLKQLKGSIRNRKSLVGKPCPTCGRSILADTVERLLNHLRTELVTVRKVFEGAEVRVAKLERKVTHWRNILKRLNYKKQKLYAYRAEAVSRRREIEKRLTVTTEQSPFFAELEETKFLYSRSLSRYLVLRQKAVELTRRIKALSFWEIGFGNKGVKTLVMREMLPSMNAKLKEYASQLFLSPVELEFRPSRETKKGEERELFHLHYKSKFNSASYAGESSGGRRRVDICVLLVFSWLARCCNLLLVDELLDGLDESGREATLNILSRQRGTVLVITHSRQIKTAIGKVWTVVKRNGVSRLEKA